MPTNAARADSASLLVRKARSLSCAYLFAAAEAIDAIAVRYSVASLHKGQETLMACAKKAGAKGWLVKPVKPEMLLKAVQQLARPA